MGTLTPELGSRVRVWNYEFKWTQDHRTAEELRPMIYTYDELATRCLDRLDKLSALPMRSQHTSAQAKPASTCPHSIHTDFYQLLQDHATEDETLRTLWEQVHTVPAWVDWDSISRGQRILYRYAGPCIVGLTFQSLLDGLASSRVVATLSRTGGFSGPHTARRRLLETFLFLLDVTHSPASLHPDNNRSPGFAACIRVRLLHAAVRRRILAFTTKSPACYPLATHGVPINDLDSLGTVLSFSAALVWIALPRQGIFLRADEIRSFLALWRYLANLLGAPDAPLASPRAARVAMESLMLAELGQAEVSGASRALARNLIGALAGQAPTFASEGFLRAEARWLNGRALAEALLGDEGGFVHGCSRGGERWEWCKGWYYMLLVAGQCLFFMALCYTRRSVASWDEAGVERMRRLLRRLVRREMGMGEGEEEQVAYEMRRVPALGKGTGAAETDQCPSEAKGRKQREPDGMGSWEKGKGVEDRNLKAVLAASALLGFIVWLGISGGSCVFQMLR